MPDFSYCQVCNRNHDQGKRHRHTAGHKTAVETLLNKQREKFAPCRPQLDHPESVPVGRQQAAWCVFCCADVRPDVAADRQFDSMHILEHLATKTHAAKVDAWFRANNADRAAAAGFKIGTAEIEKYRRRIVDLTAHIEKREVAAEKRKERNRMAREAWLPIEKQLPVPSDFFHPAIERSAYMRSGSATFTRARQVTASSPGPQAQTVLSLRAPRDSRSFPAPLEVIATPSSPYTLSAHGWVSPPGVPTTASNPADAAAIPPPEWRTNVAGPPLSGPIRLTRISRATRDAHMAPPWLESDSPASFPAGGEEIGPSAQAFLDAQRAARKKKMNPKRLGANLDRSATLSEEWLPSFGRVFNSGPRKASKRQYLEERRKR